MLQSNFHHLLLLLPFINGSNTVFHVHSTFGPSKLHRVAFYAFCRRVRLFVAVSDYVNSALVRVGVPRYKVVTVHNGFPSIVGSSKEQSQQIAVVAPLAPNDFSTPVVIGIVGQVGAWKGHEDLVRALQCLRAWGMVFRCEVYGTGQPAFCAYLERLVDEAGLREQVVFHGFVNKQDAIYPNLDICVVPSRSQDPFPTSAIEAAHFGIPVIASNRGGLPEIVQDGATGVLVDAEAPSQLAAQLRLLIADPVLRRTLGCNARRYASEYLTAQRMAADMEAVLARVERSCA